MLIKKDKKRDYNSHTLTTVDDDIFSSKAICMFLITVRILSCSNCDLLHKLKLKLSY